MTSTETQAIRAAALEEAARVAETLPEERWTDCDLHAHSIAAAIRSLISQPAAPVDVVEREPVAWQRQHPNGKWMHIEQDEVDYYRGKGQYIRPLYAALPTPDPDARAAALEEAVDQMKYIIVRFARHSEICTLGLRIGNECSCGFANAISALSTREPAGEVGDHG